ncbi:MAG: DUF1207 domain-containing protein [Pirellulaceae bacterium]
MQTHLTKRWWILGLTLVGLLNPLPTMTFADDVVMSEVGAPLPERSLNTATEFSGVFGDADRLLEEMTIACDQSLDQKSRDVTSEPWAWHLLPTTLLWHSYLADPHEPRISTVIFGDSDEGAFWDATVGGRVGLLRYGVDETNRHEGWQWDVQGAVMTRLDLLHAEDVESMDYRFGTELTRKAGPWAMKLGYFHISSHVGDEYVIRQPSYERINYVTESFVFGLSHAPTDAIRTYGEIVNSFHVAGGAKRYQFQTGIEYLPIPKRSESAVPFAAIHFNFREAVDYDVSTTAQFGWAFQSLKSERLFRVGLQVGSGPTSQYQFFDRREEYAGIGAWLDY